MKVVLVISALFIFNANLFAQDCKINMRINGIKKVKGNLIVAVFDSEKDYLKKPLKHFTLPVKSLKDITTCINDLPDGRYSISIIQDYDLSGDLSTSMFGPPNEPYGFSNNVKGFLGPPEFEDTSFDYKKGQKMDLNIQLF